MALSDEWPILHTLLISTHISVYRGKKLYSHGPALRFDNPTNVLRIACEISKYITILLKCTLCSYIHLKIAGSNGFFHDYLGSWGQDNIWTIFFRSCLIAIINHNPAEKATEIPIKDQDIKSHKLIYWLLQKSCMITFLLFKRQAASIKFLRTTNAYPIQNCCFPK